MKFFYSQIFVTKGGARAGAAVLTSWSRSRANMERLYNTDNGDGDLEMLVMMLKGEIGMRIRSCRSMAVCKRFSKVHTIHYYSSLNRVEKHN